MTVIDVVKTALKPFPAQAKDSEQEPSLPTIGNEADDSPVFDKRKITVLFVLGGPGVGESRSLPGMACPPVDHRVLGEMTLNTVTARFDRKQARERNVKSLWRTMASCTCQVRAYRVTCSVRSFS